MTLLQTTTAHAQAERNLAGNLNAIQRTQPELTPWIVETSLAVEWVFARDGSLTAMEFDGHWFGGCSLPRLAAQKMLSKLQIGGAVGCILTPAHATTLTAALKKLRPEQALIAVIPDMRNLAMMLHCEDLSELISAHRLWFAAGPAWDLNLRTLLETHLGLAVPAQFIRTPDADPDQVESLIGIAQKLFSELNGERSTQLQSAMRDIARAPARSRVCVIAGTRFRLWNDIGHTLLESLRSHSEIEIVSFDSDDPLCSSPLALVQATRDCGSVLTANTARTDLPGLISESVPWITWMTGVRVPSASLAGPFDQLILVDPSMQEKALAAGWPAARIHLGAWPKARMEESGSKPKPHLAMIVDTRSLETPKDLTDYSSHGLLWEAARQDISRNPFVVNEPVAYLRQLMRRANIAEEAFPMARFVEELILPAYQQGLARILLAAKAPLKLWGEGWDQLPEFKAIAAGAIRSRQELTFATRDASALVQLSPIASAHPMDAIPKPIVCRNGNNPNAFIRSAQAALNSSASATSANTPAFSAQLLISILNSIQ